MEIVIEVLWILLTIYCAVMYVIGIIIFTGIATENGGIAADDLKSLDFWLLVGVFVISPVSIPYYALRRD